MIIKPDTDLDPRHYTVSVHAEVWDAGAYDAGEPRERDTEVDHEEFDCDGLVQLQGNYGFNEPSSSHLPQAGGTSATMPWFRTTTPREDREHIEQGVDRFYSFHLHAVDGEAPHVTDIQRIADYFGIRFANRVEVEPAPSRFTP